MVWEGVLIATNAMHMSSDDIQKVVIGVYVRDTSSMVRLSRHAPVRHVL